MKFCCGCLAGVVIMIAPYFYWIDQARDAAKAELVSQCIERESVTLHGHVVCQKVTKEVRYD